jgi:Asp-tRNA(Asn)/Glu-tRNA(Gln) amidotransferase A subunit family amidase
MSALRADIRSRERPSWVETSYSSTRCLAGQVDAVIGVTAPGAAPVGLKTTGDPIFVVPGSLLGAPGVSLPVLDDGGLPLRLQVLGFPQGDVTVFAVAAWIAWDRFAKSKIRRPQQRSTRQCIGWIRGLQTPVAQRKGVGECNSCPVGE